jgi:DNA-directed RNA polymerase specialized sigma24 family protein
MLPELDFTSESLSRLLEAFSNDQAAAGVAYAKLRDSLVRFFRLKGDNNPDDAADETLDRVGKKLLQNPEIDDLTKYSFAVARFIFLERLKRSQKEKVAAEGFYADRTAIKTEAETDDFLPFRECFNSLTDKEKTVLQAYFADVSPSNLFAERRKLTEEYNISLNNLRLKVFRLRQRLENCVKEKLQK